MEELEKYMKALLLVQLDAAKDGGEPTNPAILLSRAGFTNPEIAELLNRNREAVKTAVLRAKKKTRRARA